MKDTDTQTIEEASKAVLEIDVRYRLLDNPDDREDLEPARDAAFDAFSRARLNLLKTGVITTEEDLVKMKNLRIKVEEAADIQDLIVAGVRVASFLAKLAIRT